MGCWGMDRMGVTKFCQGLVKEFNHVAPLPRESLGELIDDRQDVKALSIMTGYLLGSRPKWNVVALTNVLSRSTLRLQFPAKE